MTDRSGCGLVELAVLQSLEALTAGRPRAHVISARAVAAIDERIGLGPRYGYQVLLDLARPWTVAVRLVSGRGNLGGRGFDPPAADRYTESRQSRVGQNRAQIPPPFATSSWTSTASARTPPGRSPPPGQHAPLLGQAASRRGHRREPDPAGRRHPPRPG